MITLTDLSPIEILHGTFTLIFVLFSIFLGIRILLRYFQVKDTSFLLVGLTWIFMSSGWFGSGFSFLSILLFKNPLDTFTYFFIGNAFIPIAIVCWVWFTIPMIFPEKRKSIIVIYILIYILFEILLIIFLIVDYTLVGEIKGIFFFQPSIFILLFQVFAILTALVTGILFARESMRSDKEKIRWKGKLLLLAFILFTVGAIMDAVFPLNPILLVIVRSILIASSVSYYLGFILPKWLEKLLIKEEEI